jgi:hypothetical protein
MIKQFENFSYYTEIDRNEYSRLMDDNIYSFNRTDIERLSKMGFSTITCRLYNVSRIPFFSIGDAVHPKSMFSSVNSLRHFPSREFYTTEVMIDDKLIDCKNKDQIIPNTCLYYEHGQIIYIIKISDEYYLVKFCGGDLYRQKSYSVDDFGYYKCDQLDGLVDCLNKNIPIWG